MTRVRIKFCGITRAQDAEQAVSLGADAVGFVFYRESPRYIDAGLARQIIDAMPPFVTTVGLFVNADQDEINRTCDQTGIDIIQYHGDESPERCGTAPRPWIKAVRVRAAGDIAAAAAKYPDARALLLDAYDASIYGGSGQAFDWGVVPRARSHPLILAGGLDADNVAEAIRRVGPYAVDVSSGIEASKGIKDTGRMREFIEEVRRCGS